jgi:hypothetical protein
VTEETNDKKTESPERDVSIADQIKANTGGTFQLKIPIENLRKKSLFVAAPMYGGQCAGMFTRSILDLSAVMAKHDIKLTVYFLFNESLVQRARNYCVDEFLRSGATHMMFIDSDIGFDPRDILVLMAMSDDDTEYDVIGGAYPKKCISWEKIKAAVDRGAADEDPNVLEKYVGDYVLNPKAGYETFAINQPVEVRELGTGFMMIRRKTFEDYERAFPELHYKPDHARTEHFDGHREIMAYFDCAIEPETKRYLSEDYFFCYNVQKMGGKVWLCPWMKLSHVGSYVFGGSLADIASIGAHATVDVSKIKKGSNKK